MLFTPFWARTLFKDLVVVPFYVPWDEAPAASTPLQSWAIGLIFLKAWVRITVARGGLAPPPLPGAAAGGGGVAGDALRGAQAGPAAGVAAGAEVGAAEAGAGAGPGAGPGAGAGDAAEAGAAPLAARVADAVRLGLWHLPFKDAVAGVVLPTLATLLDAVCVPRVLGHVLAPVLLGWPQPLPLPLPLLLPPGQPAAGAAAAEAAGDWLVFLPDALRVPEGGLLGLVRFPGSPFGPAFGLSTLGSALGAPFGGDRLRAAAAARRLSLPLYLAFKLLFLLLRWSSGALALAHDAVRDDAYLLGVTLNNHPSAVTAAAASADAAAAADTAAAAGAMGAA